MQITIPINFRFILLPLMITNIFSLLNHDQKSIEKYIENNFKMLYKKILRNNLFWVLNDFFCCPHI